ncbi:hypothetical protein LINPERPRIM_LOCUS39749, partial [Linum perenne]
DCTTTNQVAIEVAFCGWNVWKARNDAVFSSKSVSSQQIKIKFDIEMADWVSARTHPEPQPFSPRDLNRNSVPTPRTYQRVFLCDGSFRSDVQQAGYGVIIKDHHGHVVDGKAGKFLCRAPIVAEARALQVAVSEAVIFPGSSLIVTDCLTLVTALKQKVEDWPWECAAILADIVHKLGTVDCISVCHYGRAATLAADAVARKARDSCLAPGWVEALISA